MAGLYIHIPYCRKKCIYCDFYSGGARTARWDALVESFSKEMRLRACEISDRTINSIYFGGGTPSLMPSVFLDETMKNISSIFNFDKEKAEITIEANPEDISEKTLSEWRRIGFNRLSIGAESFNDAELEWMGRSHSAAQARDAVTLASRHFSNVTLDLIFGLPRQTADSWKHSVDTAIKLAPKHISAYSLMYEEKTALTRLRDERRVEEATETDSLSMFSYLTQRLSECGYVQYEISNYALPGFESRHNSAYWSGEPYLGIGPSAHSYDGNRTRRWNPADIKGYLDFFSGNKSGVRDNADSAPFFEYETLTTEELRDEMILTAMRTCKGIDIALFAERFGKASLDRLLSVASGQEKRGVLKIADGHISLTKKGIMVADSIILELAM